MNNKTENTNQIVHRLFSTIETDGLIRAEDGSHNIEASWFTPWSIAHLIGGSLIRGMGGSIFTLILFHTAYEYIQHTDEKAKEKWRNEGYPWFFGDSIQNSIGDTISAVIGWFIFDYMVKLGRTATLVSSAALLIVGYIFLSSTVQKKISFFRSQYMKNAYGLTDNSSNANTSSYINLFGEKLPMPYAIGLFIGIGLFILYATGAYYPKIIA
jgi:hypothetical protein